MKKMIQALSAFIAMLVLGGCATGLDKTATAIDWSKGSVIVMSVEMTNKYKPNYQPTQLGVVIAKEGGEAKERVYAGSTIFAGTNAFLVTKQIQPGRYSVARILGISRSFPIQGGIDFAVNAPFEITPNSVIYLGRLVTVNKEKVNKDDQSTGGVIPLIDQAISGFGNGTLDVVLQDNYTEDVKVLKSEFAYIKNLDVMRSPLQKITLERTTGSSAPLIEVRAVNPAVARDDTGAITSPVVSK